MGSRAILTVAAATAAALGGGTASAGAAAAITAPKAPARPARSAMPVRPAVSAVPAMPAAPAMPLTTPLILPLTGVVGAENAMDIGNGWCVAPLHLSGSLTHVLSAAGQGCGGTGRSGGNGVHVLDGLCVAPIAPDDPGPTPSSNSSSSSTCDGETATGSSGPGEVSVLRGLSIVGVQATY